MTASLPPSTNAEYVRDTNSEVFVYNDNLALGDELSVHKNVDRLAGHLVKFYNSAVCQRQYLRHALARLAELHSHTHGYIGNYIYGAS